MTLSKDKSISSVLAVIPARGGSKGIPGKNVRLLNGKPLIFYAIRTAKMSSYIDEVVVTTDDYSIGTIARIYGADVVERPAYLATDEISLDPVVYHALQEVEKAKKRRFDLVVTLQPTSPLLSVSTLDKAIKIMLSRSEFDTLIAVKDATHIYWIERQGRVVPLFEERKNRQFLPRVYMETGSILISRRNIITPEKRIGEKVYIFEMPYDEDVDIDEFKDWWIAEKLLGQKKILFRVNGNREIGLGHVYRALTLAQRLSMENKIYFVFEKDKSMGKEKVERWHYPVYEISSFDDFDEILVRISPDMVINDILDTTRGYMKWLRERVGFIVNFEDMGDGGELADIVINALYENSYPPSNHFYGHRYVCLRDEFSIFPRKVVQPEVKRILITFGGTDPNNLSLRTLKAVQEINEIKCKGIVVSILLGLGYRDSHSDELYKFTNYLKKEGFLIEIKEDVPLIAKEIYESDIVITSNGRTVYEVAAIGVPCISISQNEREVRHLFTYISGGVMHLGIACNVKVEDIASSVGNLIRDFNLRAKMSENLKRFDLTRGVYRVAKLIMEKYEEKMEERR